MTSLSGNEGGIVEVCVEITSFPSGGVEIPVTLELGTADGPKACMSIIIIFILLCSARYSQLAFYAQYVVIA